MRIDKSQDEQQQVFVRSDTAVVSQGVFDQKSKLFSCKKTSVLSTKDYLIIGALSLIVVVVIYNNFMKCFHGLSEEQFTAMIQKNFHGTFLENLKDLFLGQISWDGIYMQELWSRAGWESVWAFICLIPQMLFGIAQILFPIIFVFHFMLKGELQEMVQQVEKSPEECDPVTS
ncbi:hypothetical protein [Bartonella sp. ML69XJBT]|uniref:hypothetical protein n=1 Tax=Bartonella sp. ML69XJBT TaxID=3019092 RepID=UPI0023603DA7|nr:hypothetical protein [Bartonella sp. ML69XJBT]